MKTFPNNPDSVSRGGSASPLLLLLALGIAGMCYIAFVPNYFQVRDRVRVGLAEKAVKRCNYQLRIMRREMPERDELSFTLAEINDSVAMHEEAAIVWPEAALLETFTVTTNGASVQIAVRGGTEEVSAPGK